MDDCTATVRQRYPSDVSRDEGAPGTHTILSVDDRDSNRYIRNRALTAAGFAVIEAANGSDAIKLAIEHQPSLIVLDIRLPDIDGFRGL